MLHNLILSFGTYFTPVLGAVTGVLLYTIFASKFVLWNDRVALERRKSTGRDTDSTNRHELENLAAKRRKRRKFED